MANIKKHLDNIKGALFGKDVRSSIHDGIDAINKEVESTTNRQEHLEGTFDQLIINSGNSNAEIVDARVGENGKSYAKLGDRLDEVDSQLEHIPYMNNYINVKYPPSPFKGLVGDGTTDDSANLQILLDNFKNLYFPNGTYFCDSNLVLVNTNIKGDSSVILFKDNTNIRSGTRNVLIHAKGNISMERLTFRYIAENSTLWDKQLSSDGNEGVLFLHTSGSMFSRRANYEVVDNRSNPAKALSMTCYWSKSEEEGFSSIDFANCKFINNVESTVGGCVWVSNIDFANRNIDSINIVNCDFEKGGNDEALAISSSHNNECRNIIIDNNNFKYTTSHYNDVMVSIYRNDSYLSDNVIITNNKFETVTSNQGRRLFMYFHGTNVKLERNTFNINMNAPGKIFGVQSGSNVHIINNKINCNMDGDYSIGLLDYIGGTCNLSNNEIKVNGYSMTLVSNPTCFDNSNITIENNKIDATLTKSDMTIVIQISDTGVCNINRNTIDVVCSPTSPIFIIFLNSTTKTEHDFYFDYNIINGIETWIPGNASSLKNIFIRNNISDGTIQLYGADKSYNKLFIADNTCKNIQIGWANPTTSKLSAVSNFYKFTRNSKSLDLTDITVI